LLKSPPALGVLEVFGVLTDHTIPSLVEELRTNQAGTLFVVQPLKKHATEIPLAVGPANSYQSLSSSAASSPPRLTCSQMPHTMLANANIMNAQAMGLEKKMSGEPREITSD